MEIFHIAETADQADTAQAYNDPAGIADTEAISPDPVSTDQMEIMESEISGKQRVSCVASGFSV